MDISVKIIHSTSFNPTETGVPAMVSMLDQVTMDDVRQAPQGRIAIGRIVQILPRRKFMGNDV